MITRLYSLRCDSCGADARNGAGTLQEARKTLQSLGWRRVRLFRANGSNERTDLCPSCANSVEWNQAVTGRRKNAA